MSKKQVKYRIEHDSLGKVQVPNNKYWGAQTQRSKENFTISCEKMPLNIIKAITYVKKACAIVNAKVGKLNNVKAKAIINVCNLIHNEKLNDNFPLSIW